ncbi:hypothetical protein PENSPDRAFT_757228 [Peniophora sp. CONT]|nr:hypothetical protein PENSPDRAFT_757228 [Peniophora sp. CONT]
MSMTITGNIRPTRSGVQDPFAFAALERFSTMYGPERHILKKPLNGNILVGRGPHNDLVLEDQHISWSHCVMTYVASDPAVVTITAMRTRNGTFVNGVRLKPGQTCNLSDDDLISLGTPAAPQKLTRRDEDSVHIPGVYAERYKLRQIGWQFKFYLFTPGEAAQGTVARTVYHAWNAITRSKARVLVARSTLTRMQGVHHLEERLQCAPPEIPQTERPTTPTYIPPPAHLDWPGAPPFDFMACRTCRAYPHASGLSWYHPDFVFAGETPLLVETPVCELPSAISVWSQAYGLPQGLHPRWREFSSLQYGDDCRDIHSSCVDSVLLQGTPAPSEATLQVARIEENIRRRDPELAAEPAQYSAEDIASMSRQEDNDRLYEENDRLQSPLPLVSPSSKAAIDGRPLDIEHHERSPVDMGEEKRASPSPPADALASEVTASPLVQAPRHARRSNKRKLNADDFSQRSADSNAPTTAALEHPRKRLKRDAHTKSKHAAGSHTAHPSASTSARGVPTSAEASRPLKRARPRDEEAAEERPAKRVTRATTIAQAAIAPCPYKRRQPEPGDDEPVQEEPAMRTTRAAKDAPAAAIDTTASRSLKRQRTDFEDEQPAIADTHTPSRPLKRQRPEHDCEEPLQPHKRATKRITRAASNAPYTMVDGTSHPVRCQRPTDTVMSVETSEADDTNTRRSARLKSKQAPTRYR